MTQESLTGNASAQQVVQSMMDAWSRNDVEGVVATFAPDATVESPLVQRVLNRKDGVCRGHDEIGELVRAIAKRGRPWGGHRPPLVRGNTVAVEYTSPSSDDVPVSVDLIEVKDGKIQSLRAYLGWRAVAAMTGQGPG